MAEDGETGEQKEKNDDDAGPVTLESNIVEEPKADLDSDGKQTESFADTVNAVSKINSNKFLSKNTQLALLSGGAFMFVTIFVISLVFLRRHLNKRRSLKEVV